MFWFGICRPVDLYPSSPTSDRIVFIMFKIVLVAVMFICTAVIAICAAIWRLRPNHAVAHLRRHTAAPMTAPASPAGFREAVIFTPIETTTTSDIQVHPKPPVSLGDWYQWTESQRLDFVTNSQHDGHPPAELLEFFRAAVFDRQLGLVTRNNMANCLVGQESRDPTLAAVFKKLMEDSTEDVQWRDYALQFLATSIDWSSNPKAMAATIWDQAQHRPGTVSGTALLHLHYIDQRGVSTLPSGYDDRLATCLTDVTVDLSTRMTAVGIIGQRGLKTRIETIRTLAEQAPKPALRRTALATLGMLGDQADLALVRRYTANQDALIAAAAKGAECRLAQANPTPEPAAPPGL